MNCLSSKIKHLTPPPHHCHLIPKYKGFPWLANLTFVQPKRSFALNLKKICNSYLHVCILARSYKKNCEKVYFLLWFMWTVKMSPVWFAGTMDLSTTKMLSLHTESLLPPTSVELDVTQNMQVAALLGVGLVYQGTAHRHMAEILLSEMGENILYHISQ